MLSVQPKPRKQLPRRISFWEMHDMIFTNQDALDDESLRTLCRKNWVWTCSSLIKRWNPNVHAARVKDDFQSGVRSGVNGTPTFFINGDRYDGPISQQADLRSH
jgi:formate-nitrite transporter family protein